jgi:hypothetical protein
MASLGKKEDSISTNKQSVVSHLYNSSYMGGVSRKITVKGQPPAKSMRPYLINNWKQKGLRGWLEVVVHLPGKYKALRVPPQKEICLQLFISASSSFSSIDTNFKEILHLSDYWNDMRLYVHNK